MNLEALKGAAFRGALQLKKYSPEILMGIGIVGTVVGSIESYRKFLEVQNVLEEAANTLFIIDETKGTEYTENNIKKIYDQETARNDSIKVFAGTSIIVAKKMLPGVLLTGASIACIVGSRNILVGRNAALAAAYSLLDASYKKYRERVIAEFGEDKDFEYRFGYSEETATIKKVDAKGKEIEPEDEDELPACALIGTESMYARSFNSSNPQWKDHPDYVMSFLISQERYANQVLQAQGHLFLNEVYDNLTLKRGPAGAVVGWLSDGPGDCVVSFGLNNPVNRAFKEGRSKEVILDFNVDGTIYDKI